MISGLQERIFTIDSQQTFQDAALEIFEYQAENNKVYRCFLQAINSNPRLITDIKGIPFLPVEFFKSHKIITGNSKPDKVFESSGTTGTSKSRHYVASAKLYEESLLRAFRIFYGDPSNYTIAALLPSYAERENSSLIYMMKCIIEKSEDPFSGFFTDNIDNMLSGIWKSIGKGRKAILIGVSYALLDLAEKYAPDLSGAIVMETGGMKGKRKEITRDELHSVLKQKLNVSAIHSEYGMTELLSQAYSEGEGKFLCPPWMKILIRDPRDPMSVLEGPCETGCINVIDLANIHSCSFIATSDLGKLNSDGSFGVLGRFDNSDIRGCNLLIE